MDETIYPSLKGRRVLVTGGATGIGASLVKAYQGQGARVAFVDRDLAAGEALAASLAGLSFFAADVTIETAFLPALERAISGLGGLDILVNNVANDQRQAAAEMTPRDWRAALAVNLDAAFIASRAGYESLRRSRGVILNISSINALLGPPQLAAYSAAKGGLNALTKALAREWGPDGIRVNALSPGWVITERQLDLWLTPEAEAAWAAQVALKTRIMPLDIARLALFLTAQDSALITGQNFVIDAGRT